MSTEVDIAFPDEVVDPTTGELVSRGDTPGVVRFYQRIGELQRQFRNPRDWANQVLLEWLDSQAKWTVECAGFKVTAPSPESAEIVWELDELEKLQEHLPPERYAELVKQTVSYEPQTLALQNAAKAGGVIAEIIERAQTRKPKRRYVRVSN